MVSTFEHAAKQTQQFSEKSLETSALRFGIALALAPYRIHSKGQESADTIELNLWRGRHCSGSYSGFAVASVAAAHQDGEHQRRTARSL